MARGRYDTLGLIDGNAYETFVLEQTNRFKQPDTFVDVSTFEYVVRRGDRLDLLAAKFLNDDRYWWAIALVNDLVAPFVEPGDKIKIPFDVRQVLDRM